MRRLIFSLTLLALPAAPVSVMAQDKPKPNTLTPKEIADGWILLFDGATTFGWKIDGDAKVIDGTLQVGEKKDSSARQTCVFGSFDLEFEYQVPSEKQAKELILGTEKVNLPCPEAKGWHHATLHCLFDPQTTNWNFSGGFGLPEKKLPFEAFKQTGFKRQDNQNPIEFRVGAGTVLSLRNIKLKPLNQKSLFNGKDLTGWKEIPGKKSKFTVNDKGELNIKNGPGDLHTTGEWDDFVLQLDVISNGKHLNSGVFFRCQPGEFWSGYEAQIRNQWQGDDRTKAVDYGTGGIYNRQPARKVVSTDKEWFTMTVVAHGNLLATWVDGYQVTDFTDTRPADKSARNGLKLDKGPISLQGHDPTTDLNFRNIRIEAMPPPAKK